MCVATRNTTDGTGRDPQLVLSETTREQAIGFAGPYPRRANPFAPLLITIAVMAGVFAIVAGVVLGYGLRHGATTYRGVHAAGVDLSGMTVAEAQAALDARVQASAPSSLTLVAGDQRWDVPLDQIGARFDTAATARQAYDYGRSGSLWADSGKWLRGLVKGHEEPLVVQVDQRAIVELLQAHAPAVTHPPLDARYAVDGSGKLTVQPAAAGRGIDAAGTIGAIRASLAQLSNEPVPLATVELPPAVTDQALQAGLEQAQAMVSEPLTLESGGRTWQIGPDALGSLLVVEAGADGAAPKVTLSTERLKPIVASLTDQVKQPGKNAGLTWQDDQFVVTPSANGEALDVDATVAEITRALQEGKHQVALKLRQAPAAIIEADAEAAAQRAQALVATPLKVTWSGGEATLAPADLAGLLTFKEQPDAPEKLAVDVDDGAVKDYLASIAPQVEVEGKDADLRYYDGAVKVVSPEKTGVKIDVDQSVAAIKEAVLGGAGSVALVTQKVEPKVTAAMADSIVIREKLSSAQTYYGGGVSNRIHNVELAVERANGALIPPGGTYSFVGTVGAVDLNSGYRVGYGIVGTSNGSVSTVPSVGGGICQVSTTAFQAAFWAGMPIVERNWHLYWIPSYGQPPSGLKGLDATVDTDYGLDFKFKNTTDNWLAMVATADGQWVRFELWGTDPGWQVQVDDPVVTDVVKADTKMQYRETDQLPKGSSVLVEHAEDGFNVDIHRVVTKDGEVVDDLHLRSQYRPSANVTLVGTAE